MEQNATMTLGDFRTALKRAALFTAHESSRPVLECVKISIGAGSVRFDATDGVSLAVQRFDAETTGKADALLRRDDVASLIKALPRTRASDDDTITIAIDDEQINITHDVADEDAARGQRYSYRSAPEKFPDVARLIPRDLDASDRETTQRVALDAGHAIAINKAAVIGTGASGIVRWYTPRDQSSSTVALIGTNFVAVVMPMFVQWDKITAESTTRYVLGEFASEATEADDPS